MARDSEPRYAPYPAEIKSAAMVKSYDKLTFQEQVMADVQREMRVLSATHPKIIDRFFKELKGTITTGEYDDGTPNPAEYWFSLGSTTVCIQFGKDMKPLNAIHYMDLTQSPIVKGLEVKEIADVISAICYSDAPDKAGLALMMSQVNLRNSQMVNGIQDVANRIKEDSLLLTQALSGANIEQITQGDIYKGVSNKMTEEEEK